MQDSTATPVVDTLTRKREGATMDDQAAALAMAAFALSVSTLGHLRGLRIVSPASSANILDAATLALEQFPDDNKCRSAAAGLLRSLRDREPPPGA